MKIIFLTLVSIVDIAIIGLIVLNFSNNATFNLLPDMQYNLSSWMILLIGTVLGCFSSTLMFLFLQIQQRDQMYRQIRTAEKASIQAEESSDKVKALEAKIQTLEQALQKALNR